MDNLRRLLEDEEDEEYEELFQPEPQDNFTSESDDDGYDSVGNSSEPEEIIVDKRFPTPAPPPPSSMPFILNNDVVEPILNLMRVPRRQEDLYQPYSRKLSYGYEKTGHSLRRGIRSSELVGGQGVFNGYKHRLMPIRIIGCFKKRRQLYYFVEWEGRDGAFPLDASIVTRRSPNMVIRYHQDFIYNPSRFRHL
ncbi:unnamed protein product [Macrosiphum euphorbiae]|uniref:Chromo domain-containing protein n=1 Tax=Macrosiphum euphorbiae TaxID=13131 RepID=A0AAV0XSQ8_9HEMI|nr:unnamed protein product [Macrosiphum euphorbiae]